MLEKLDVPLDTHPEALAVNKAIGDRSGRTNNVARAPVDRHVRVLRQWATGLTIEGVVEGGLRLTMTAPTKTALTRHRVRHANAAAELRLETERGSGKPVKGEHLRLVGQLIDHMAARQQGSGANP